MPPLAGWGLSGQTLKTWDWPPALLPAALLIAGGQSTWPRCGSLSTLHQVLPLCPTQGQDAEGAAERKDVRALGEDRSAIQP